MDTTRPLRRVPNNRPRPLLPSSLYSRICPRSRYSLANTAYVPFLVFALTAILRTLPPRSMDALLDAQLEEHCCRLEDLLDGRDPHQHVGLYRNIIRREDPHGTQPRYPYRKPRTDSDTTRQ